MFVEFQYTMKHRKYNLINQELTPETSNDPILTFDSIKLVEVLRQMYMHEFYDQYT